MKNTVRIFLGLMVLVLLLSNACCGIEQTGQRTASANKAPDFSLYDLEGNRVTLSQFNGKSVVLLVFFATWCPPCRHEISEVKEIYSKYNDKDVKVLSINVQESSAKLRSFAKEYSIPYTILLDTTGEVANSYGVRGIPHMSVIDKDGGIYYNGNRPYGGLMPVLDKLLKK